MQSRLAVTARWNVFHAKTIWENRKWLSGKIEHPKRFYTVYFSYFILSIAFIGIGLYDGISSAVQADYSPHDASQTISHDILSVMGGAFIAVLLGMGIFSVYYRGGGWKKRAVEPLIAIGVWIIYIAIAIFDVRYGLPKLPFKVLAAIVPLGVTFYLLVIRRMPYNYRDRIRTWTLRASVILLIGAVISLYLIPLKWLWRINAFFTSIGDGSSILAMGFLMAFATAQVAEKAIAEACRINVSAVSVSMIGDEAPDELLKENQDYTFEVTQITQDSITVSITIPMTDGEGTSEK